jgi:hypothetical protein
VADWSLAASRGFSLFPLIHHSKRPAIDKWEPYQEIPASPDQIAAWSAQPYNTGVATGAVSGVVVLDCDSLMARIEAETRGVPETLTVATPRGTHFYFRHPGHEVTNHAGQRWTTRAGGPPVDGWDIRGDGGYVVGPGSWYEPTPDELAKGKVAGRYAIELDVPLAPLPEWLSVLLAPRDHRPAVPARFSDTTSVYGQKCLSSEIAILENCTANVSDQINASAFAIGQLVAGGEIEASEAMEALTNALAVLGLEHEYKANDTVERGYAAGLEQPRGVEHDVPRPPLDIRAVLGTRVVPDDFIPPAPPVRLTSAIVTRAFIPAEWPRYINSTNMHDYFEGVVYVAKDDQMFLPSGVMVGKSAFDAIYGGPGFVADFEGEGKPIKSAWEMFRQNEHYQMSKVWSTCFRPLLPAGQIVDLEGLPALNTYVPIEVPRMAGDAAPFVEHVRKMLPHGDDANRVIQWMAACVQTPGAKFQWWPVIQGTKGNGKSLLLRVMMRAVGERYSHLVRSDALLKTGNQFNDWIVGKLFLGFEEIKSAEGKRDFVDMMKDTVTNERLATEGKGKSQGTSDNCANGIMLTNYDDACPIDDDERRWGVFFCAQQSQEDLLRDGMTPEYFKGLYEWLRDLDGYAIVTEYLACLPLAYEMNPANGWKAPETTTTRQAISSSLGILEQEILEAVEGRLHGFKGDVINSFALRGLFDRLRKTIAPRRYRKIMASIGYDVHPELVTNKWRLNKALSDGSTPVLYFKRGSPGLRLREVNEIAEFVENEMTGVVGGMSNVVPIRGR